MSSKQRRRLKRYDILKIGEIEKLFEGTDETAELCYFRTVIVRVPDVDRGRLAPRNVLAVVLSINDSKLYLLGMYERKMVHCSRCYEFTLVDSNFIDISSVLPTLVSLRTASALASGSKRGFVQSNSKSYCVDKKCACRAKKIVCNSKCLNNSSCKNSRYT
nr:unnamed protein product [Callosobruchus analis]